MKSRTSVSGGFRRSSGGRFVGGLGPGICRLGHITVGSSAIVVLSRSVLLRPRSSGLRGKSRVGLGVLSVVVDVDVAGTRRPVIALGGRLCRTA